MKINNQTNYKDGKFSCELCGQWHDERSIEIWHDESFINPINVNVFLCKACFDDYTHSEIKERFRP